MPVLRCLLTFPREIWIFPCLKKFFSLTNFKMQFINVFSINTEILFKGIQSFHVLSHIIQLCLEYNRSQIYQNLHSYLQRDSQGWNPDQQQVVY